MSYNAEKFGFEIDVIVSELAETLKKKNADYGNNVDKNIDEWGLASLAIRLDDKLSRFKNLIKESNTRQVSDEAIEDTLLDLAGYAILGYRKIREMNDEPEMKISGGTGAVAIRVEHPTTKEMKTIYSNENLPKTTTPSFL